MLSSPSRRRGRSSWTGVCRSCVGFQGGNRAGADRECGVGSYLRVRQTAKLAAERLDYEDELPASAKLTPMASPMDTWAEVRALRREPSLLLVGHEPHMSSFTGYLPGTPELRVDFKKGAIVRIDLLDFGVQPRGVLKWMMAPKLAL